MSKKKPEKAEKDFKRTDSKESAGVGSGEGRNEAPQAVKPNVSGSAAKAGVEDLASDAKATANATSGSDVPSVNKVSKSSVIRTGVGASVRSAPGSGVSGVGGSLTLPGAGGVDSTLAANRSNVPNPVTGVPGGRTERIIFPDAKKINDIVSEQTDHEMILEPRLNQQRSELQGFNGIEDDMFRARKIDGSTDSNWLDNTFFRSMDYLLTDRIVHATGQVLERADLTDVYPAQTYNPSTGQYANVADKPTRGNFALRGLKITLNRYCSGARGIKNVEFQSHEFPGYLNYVDGSVPEASCLEGEIDNDWISRDAFPKLANSGGIAEPGKYVQLGTGIAEPIAFNTLLRDIEAIDGSILLHAIATFDTAWANVMNMRSKFGNDAALHRNFVLNPIEGSVTDGDMTGNIQQDANFVPFGAAAYANASISMMIAIRDSPAKFNTVADILIQKRSPKEFLGEAYAVAKHGKFRIKPEFKKYLDYNRVVGFSSDEYDGVTPMLYTRSIGLMLPTDLAKLATWNSTTGRFDGKYTYVFQALHAYDMSREVVPAIMGGIGKWLVDNGAKLCELFNVGSSSDSAEDVVVQIPFNFNNFKPDLGTALICGAAGDMHLIRENTMRDVDIATEKLGAYPYDQLKLISGFDPLQHVGYTTKNVIERDGYKTIITPISAGPVSKEQKLLFTDPECIMYTGYFENGTLNKDHLLLLQPWYMGNGSFSVSGGVWENNEVMNWFALRKVMARQALLELAEIGPYQYRRLKDMAMLPYCYSRTESLINYSAGNYASMIASVIEEGAGNTISGGTPEATMLKPTVEEVLCNIREFGWQFPCPPGFLERKSLVSTDYDAEDAFITNYGSTVRDLSTMSVMVFQGALPVTTPGTAYRQGYRRLWADASMGAQATFGTQTGLFMSMGSLASAIDYITLVANGADVTSRRTWPHKFLKNIFSCALTDIFEPGLLDIDTGEIGEQSDNYDYYVLDDAVEHGFAGMEPSTYSRDKDLERERRQAAKMLGYFKNELMYQENPILK